MVLIVYAPAAYIVGMTRMIVGSVQTIILIVKSNNRLFWGLGFVGGLMNIVAIMANGFKMPVFTNRKEEFFGIHKKGDSGTKLKVFCDVYHGGLQSVFSLGDVILTIAFFLLLFKAVKEEFEALASYKRRFYVFR